MRVEFNLTRIFVCVLVNLSTYSNTHYWSYNCNVPFRLIKLKGVNRNNFLKGTYSVIVAFCRFQHFAALVRKTLEKLFSFESFPSLT